MKILILFALTIAATAQAQQHPADCLKLKKVEIASHVIHQHSQTLAELTLKVKNCHIIEEHEQTTITFESKPGLDVTVDDIAFRRSDDGTAKIKEVSVAMRLIALPELPVGESTLRGTLTYQALNDAGVIVSERQPFDIPLKIAPPKPYKPDNEPSGFVKGLEIAGEILVGIPLLIVMMIWCPISGQCPDC